MENNNTVSAIDIFYTPRKEGEPDLCALIYLYFKEIVDESSANIFINDLNVSAVVNLNPNSQRITINQFLVNALLMLRGIDDTVDVNSVLGLITNEASLDDWSVILKDMVIPYFKEHNILNRLYGVTTE